MSGFPITPMVRFVTVFNDSLPLMTDIEAHSALRNQESPSWTQMNWNPLLPTVLASKHWLTSGLLTLKFLRVLPGFITIRPSVVDARVYEPEENPIFKCISTPSMSLTYPVHQED